MFKWLKKIFLANCVNAHSDDAKCREWALDGECTINPAWMPNNCASDCHTCKNNGSLPDDGVKTTRGVVVTRPPVVTTPPPTTPTPSMLHCIMYMYHVFHHICNIHSCLKKMFKYCIIFKKTLDIHLR